MITGHRAAWTVAAIVLTVGSGVPTAGSSTIAPLPLHVLLTVSSNLTATSRTALIAETERIWRHEHVEIEFARAGHVVEQPDAPLRVLVVARPETRPRTGGAWPVAELIPEAAPRPLAIASIIGAERVVNEATRAMVLEARAPRDYDYRLGLVLGRAVAHEIGHFLLATDTHADTGLMRATVDSREFAALQGDTFRLDRDASEWLQERLTAANSAVATVRAGGFTYVRRSRLPEPQLPTALRPEQRGLRLETLGAVGLEQIPD